MFFVTTIFFLDNGKDDLCKFDTKVDECLFLRYSTSSKALHIYKKTMIIE